MPGEGMLATGWRGGGASIESLGQCARMCIWGWGGGCWRHSGIYRGSVLTCVKEQQQCQVRQGGRRKRAGTGVGEGGVLSASITSLGQGEPGGKGRGGGHCSWHSGTCRAQC